MDYSDRQVIVTEEPALLGSAVVGALVEAGTTCYGPWPREARWEYGQVKLSGLSIRR
jgi:hypothetical protein